MDLADAVRASLEVLGYGLRSAGVEVTLDMVDLPPVNGDRDLLGQVFSNLLINAQQVLTTRTLPRRIAISGHRDGEFVVLRIADNGPGVPEAIRARIFEPYFTTKAVEVGTGIGLSISRSVIEGHGGSITLLPGGGDLPGACFEIRLPVAQTLPAVADAVDRASTRTLNVLVVDDEPDVAAVLGEMLESEGHRVHLEASGEAALARIADGDFDVVFTDLRMPGLDGADLSLAVARDFPALAGRVVLMTGDSVAGPDHARRKGLLDPVIMEKPFLPKDVRAVLKLILASS
jgi:CheY-like chemotaxis protein